MDFAKREHVTITQHGRPAVAMVNVEDSAELRRMRAAREMMEFIARLPPVPEVQAMADADLSALVKTLR